MKIKGFKQVGAPKVLQTLNCRHCNVKTAELKSCFFELKTVQTLRYKVECKMVDCYQTPWTKTPEKAIDIWKNIGRKG